MTKTTLKNLAEEAIVLLREMFSSVEKKDAGP